MEADPPKMNIDARVMDELGAAEQIRRPQLVATTGVRPRRKLNHAEVDPGLLSGVHSVERTATSFDAPTR
ncbi:MAG: hypothetical protein ACR2KJ_18770 [Jatrophihabitans sp.]